MEPNSVHSSPLETLVTDWDGAMASQIRDLFLCGSVAM